jgi:protein-arginine kinase activator protein McsA
MSVVEKLKSVITFDEETRSKKRFKCQNCETEFESYKLPERAVCTECLSQDVAVEAEL